MFICNEKHCLIEHPRKAMLFVQEGGVYFEGEHNNRDD